MNIFIEIKKKTNKKKEVKFEIIKKDRIKLEQQQVYYSSSRGFIYLVLSAFLLQKQQYFKFLLFYFYFLLLLRLTNNLREIKTKLKDFIVFFQSYWPL